MSNGTPSSAAAEPVALPMARPDAGRGPLAWVRTNLFSTPANGAVTLLTLGLFIFAINGMMFMLAAWFLEGFVVDGFLAGIIGSALYIVGLLLTDISYTLVDPRIRLQ